MLRRNDIRNIAIIAHVDHGKTTLVDGFLEASKVLEGDYQEAFLDSNPLERERGITILAKNVSLRHRGIKINLIDTPGHADFGGEVERVLKMADGVLLLVDAAEGPMPQTTFVLSKALSLKLIPVVIVNKIDRPDARPDDVVQLIYDLFIDLGADDRQINFPVLYASGRSRISGNSPDKLEQSLVPLMNAMIDAVPGPEVEPERPLQVMITNFSFDEYVGRIGIGRIVAGTATNKMQVAIVKMSNGSVHKGMIKRLEVFEGLGRIEVQSAEAGEIIAMVGLENVDIGDTVTHPDYPVPLPAITVDEPTVTMEFGVNDSPFAGKEGTYVTSRQLKDRLWKAAEADVALRCEPGDSPERFRISGRGVLHLGILIENMRREGYEFAVSSPQVIFKTIDGRRCEPVESVAVDLPTDMTGRVIELLGSVRGELEAMEQHGKRSILRFVVPSRGLIGMRSRVLMATQGEAVFTHRYERHEPYKGEMAGRPRGAIIATDSGNATAYALQNLSDRGIFFVRPGTPVYKGMVVGEQNREGDLVANIVREKALTNIRSSNKEATVTLKAPRDMSLEEALEWLAQDELLEVTPVAFRIRKRDMSARVKRRAEKDEE